MFHLVRHLESAIDELSAVARYGDPCEEISAVELANDVLLRAARSGFASRRPVDVREALAELGRCLTWATPTLSADEVARMLGIFLRTLWRWEGQGKIPEGRRIGKTVRWDRRQFDYTGR